MFTLKFEEIFEVAMFDINWDIHVKKCEVKKCEVKNIVFMFVACLYSRQFKHIINK